MNRRELALVSVVCIPITIWLIGMMLASCAMTQTSTIPGNPNEVALRNVAAALRDVALGVGVFEQTVMDANAQGTITDDAARPLITLSLKVSQAGKEAIAVTRNINQLTPIDRQNILSILNPVIVSVGTSLQQDVINIKDLKTRSDIRTVFLLIQTSLNTARLVLVSSR